MFQIIGTISILLFVVATISILTDFILFKKIKTLILLDKRQQQYISDLISYNTKMIVLQKLYFCISLINQEETKEFGLQKLHENFQLPENFETNAKNLIIQFQKMIRTKQFSFMIKDGKYIIK